MFIKMFSRLFGLKKGLIFFEIKKDIKFPNRVPKRVHQEWVDSICIDTEENYY